MLLCREGLGVIGPYMNWHFALPIVMGTCFSGGVAPLVPIAVVAQSKAWVCGHLLAGIASSNLAGGIDVCLL